MLLYRTLLITAVSSGLMLAQDNRDRSKDQRNPSDQRTPSTDRRSTSENQKSSSAAADTGKSSTLSTQDKRFIQETAKNGHKEVETAKMAVEKATNQDVKQFAQRLVDDHSKMNRDLQEVAMKKGVQLEDHSRDHSQTSGSGAATSRQGERQRESGANGSDKHMKGDASLAKLSGAQFDRAFMKKQLDNHEKTIRNFERQSNSTTDSDLRNFITTHLPTIKEHRDQAKSLMTKVGGDTGTSRSTTSESSTDRSNPGADRSNENTKRSTPDTDSSGGKKRNQ